MIIKAIAEPVPKHPASSSWKRLPPKSGTMLAEVKWAAAAAGGGEP